MKEGIIGFFCALLAGLGVVAAIWKYLDFVERRVAESWQR